MIGNTNLSVQTNPFFAFFTKNRYLFIEYHLFLSRSYDSLISRLIGSFILRQATPASYTQLTRIAKSNQKSEIHSEIGYCKSDIGKLFVRCAQC